MYLPTFHQAYSLPRQSPPLPRAFKHGSTIPLLLASVLPTTTIITLSYRLSPIPSPHTFPLPIFDTPKAFDYTTSNRSPHNGGQTPRLSLYGSHIGSLPATTLALTEPTAVHALAVSELVVDWVNLDEIEEENKNTAVKRRPKSTPSAFPSRSHTPTEHSLQALPHPRNLLPRLHLTHLLPPRAGP
jgi:hypothetical protein